MKKTVIDIQGLAKQYRLGVIGTHTLRGDVEQWWYKLRGQKERLVAVDKTYSEDFNWALTNVNLSIQQGDIVGIIGRNGAGKSSLLKILSRVTTPTLGRVRVRGRIASLLEVGTGFHRELTGRENIFLNGAILGMKHHEIRNKLDEIVSFSGVEKYLDTPVKRYSSGMFVRLAFAVAAHLEPEILIVDEVLAVGDAEFQRKAIGKMKDVSETSGRTVLFVSHNMTLIRKLCTRGVVLDAGTVALDDTTDKAINFYLQSLPKALEVNASHRKGNGKLRLLQFKAYSDSRQSLSALQTGEPAFLAFEFAGELDFDTQPVNVDFRIDNQWGDRVLWLSTELIEHRVKSNTVVFNLERCPLQEGKYHITLLARVAGETADWIENAASFQVHEGDFYRTGQKIPRMQTHVWVDFKVQS